MIWRRGCGRRRRTRSSSARRTVDLDPGVPEVLEDDGCVRLDGDLVSEFARRGPCRVRLRLGLLGRWRGAGDHARRYR